MENEKLLLDNQIKMIEATMSMRGKHVLCSSTISLRTSSLCEARRVKNDGNFWTLMVYGKNFCGFCLKACMNSGDCHSHVSKCSLNPDQGNIFTRLRN